MTFMFGALMKWMQANKILPQVSDTERQALEAGQVWADGEFFAGNPDFRKMLAYSYHRLTPEEQAFLDGPVEQLLDMADGHALARSEDVPEVLMDFMRRKGFFGLIVPKAYGGLGFSTLARSAVMAKVTPHSGILYSLVVIPNTLGAAELLVEYGTPEQKAHYLPKLATGEMLPCFALTEPSAGSDAASIQAEGEVFRDADGEIRIRLNFRKRYITLAPIAHLISLACSLRDPQNLLGKGIAPGISVVLVHRGTPGLQQGDRHCPVGEAFPNGPLVGKNVIVPASQILGGAARAGEGWKMLMESLAGGRVVSLPAGAVGGTRGAAAVVGAYSMVRQQFGMPIGHMEGVEDRVARIAGLSYMLEGARVLGCSAVDDGIHPPVISAVLKAYTTELARQSATDAMDVFAGSGIMQGPSNVVARGYCSSPVAVTVEGANIMTRTLIIFGQGATRSHPYVSKVIDAVEQGNATAFRNNLLAWLWQFFSGFFRTAWRGVTRGLTVSVPDVHPQTRTYYRRLGWASMRFGFLTNLALFFVGGRLKARGKLTGRYADVLAWMVLGFSALKRFEAEGRREEDLPLVHYALGYALTEVQRAFEGIYLNFDGFMGRLLRGLALPLLRLNPLASLPDDALSRAAARTHQRDDAQFWRLQEGMYLPTDGSPGIGRLMLAFQKLAAVQPVLEKIQAAQKARQLPRGNAEDMAALAEQRGLITPQEVARVGEARAARLAAIEVDVFKPGQLFAPVSAVRSELKQAANF